MSEIKRLVLDVLKPHAPSMIELSKRLGKADGVLGVNCIVGQSINYDAVEKVIRACGAVIHSVDSVSSGKTLVDTVETPQDR